MDRRTVMAGGVAALVAPVAPAVTVPSRRIEALLARLTLADKAGQLSCFSDTVRPLGHSINPGEANRSAEAMLAEVAAGQVGMLFNGYGIAGARRAQQAALAGRVGVPLLFAADIIHGARTIFPVPLAEAAAFDPDLSTRITRAVATEASAGGLHWTFAPMVDVARDQRWGRVVEGAGEDVLLDARLAAARVAGFQGVDLRRPDTLCATPKHFLGYGAVTGGMEYAAVDLSRETLRAIHLPPFRAAIAAGAGAVMASFTDVNGVPATANRFLLHDLLREELGFAGVCISDYDAVAELVRHGVAADGADAARLAILAGIDMDMQSGLFRRHLPALVSAGAVPLARLDQAVGRVLVLKEQLGVLDDPFRSLRPAASPAPRALAREAAERVPVLLKNEGDLLPLVPGRQRLALIGPFGADRAGLDGSWSFAGPVGEGVDLATAIRALLPDPGGIRAEQGCLAEAPLEGGIARAVAVAMSADLVLLALGEAADMSGEGNSRADLRLPEPQAALAAAIAATGRPTVVILRHGRALALDHVVAAAPAILAGWFGGVEAAAALADLLFGRVAPRGRLPVSFPFLTGQEPWSYDRMPTGRPAAPDLKSTAGGGRWRDAPDRARFPFGFGLTYTSFGWSDAALLPGPAVAVTVRNTGARTGADLVQVYARRRLAARSRPSRQLVGFTWVTVKPGEATRAVVPLAPGALALLDRSGPVGTSPIDLWVARDSADPGQALTLAGG